MAIQGSHWAGRMWEEPSNGLVFTYDIRLGGGGRGDIAWILAAAPGPGREWGVGERAVEHCSWVYAAGSRELRMTGTAKTDPAQRIALDAYVLTVSPDGGALAGRTCAGGERGDAGTWTGRMDGARVVEEADDASDAGGAAALIEPRAWSGTWDVGEGTAVWSCEVRFRGGGGGGGERGDILWAAGEGHAAAVEHVAWTYDASSSEVHMRGTARTESAPTIALDEYRLEISGDGLAGVTSAHGSWDGRMRLRAVAGAAASVPEVPRAAASVLLAAFDSARGAPALTAALRAIADWHAAAAAPGAGAKDDGSLSVEALTAVARTALAAGDRGWSVDVAAAFGATLRAVQARRRT